MNTKAMDVVYESPAALVAQ